MARRFGGLDGDNRIILDVGDIVSDGGPITVLFLWRPAVTWDNVLITGVASGSETWAVMALSDDRYYTAGDFSGVPGVAVDEWQIAGYSKASGSDAARWHILIEGGTWAHADGSSIGDQGAPTSLWIGNGPNDLAGLRLRGDWVAAAVWNTELSDIQVQSAVSMTALQTWFDSGPAALWDGDQEDTSDPVVDRTGGGADQTASSGPAVVSDAPTGWSYAIAPGDETDADPYGLTLALGQPAAAAAFQVDADPAPLALTFGAPTIHVDHVTTAAAFPLTLAYGTPATQADDQRQADPLALTLTFGTPVVAVDSSTTADPLALTLTFGPAGTAVDPDRILWLPTMTTVLPDPAVQTAVPALAVETTLNVAVQTDIPDPRVLTSVEG